MSLRTGQSVKYQCVVPNQTGPDQGQHSVNVSKDNRKLLLESKITDASIIY